MSRRGDGWDSIEELFESTNLRLWRLALRMSGSVEAAGDLVQETFLRAMQRTLPADERAAEAWLFRTLVNLSHDRHRRRRVRRANTVSVREAGAIGPAPNPESAAVASDALGRAIAGLPPRRRAILLLRELEGLPVESIAATFGLRDATVRWHLARAKKDLRRFLESER